MESVAPPLKLIWCAKKCLDRGLSLRRGIQEYLQSEDNPWKEQVLLWFIRLQQGMETESLIQMQKTKTRQYLLKLLERGLRGESIYSHLTHLEMEVREQMEGQMEDFMGRLPYFLLIPLAFFLFPACLILLLGPFILQLMQTLS